MKIRRKIISVFSLVIIFSILTVGFFSYFEIKSTINNEARNKLEAIAVVQHNRVESEIEVDLERYSGVSKLVGLLLAVEKYKKEGGESNQSAIRDILVSVKNSISDFNDIFIINGEGLVIASTDAGLNGEDYKEDMLYITGKDEEHTEGHVHFSREKNKKSHLYVHGPLIFNDKLLGVLVLDIKVENFMRITGDYAGLGETGETLIAKRDENGDAIFLNERRFEDIAEGILVPKERVDIAITQALLKNESIYDGLVDYREVPVLSVTRYIESTDWGLVVKIDKSELLKPITSFRNLLMFVIAVSLILSFILSFTFSRLITKPIEILHKGTEFIEKGNFEYKVGVNTKDEIGQLSRSFDIMTATIKKSRAEVDKKVEEQTRDIEEKKVYLENQQKAILNILEDVEEEKNKVSQEKDKIDSILHSIGDGVFVIDEDYNIIIYNQVASDISGFSKEEVIGERYDKILRFIHEDTKKVNNKFITDVFVTGEVNAMPSHTLLIKKDGSEIPVADSAAPIKDKEGKVFGCIVVFRDVTQERAIDRAKSEFVSLASHQLRTPLSAINWYTEMLLADKKLEKKQKNYLEEVYKGSQRMVELVNALLNVSRLELGTFMIEPELFDIRKIADEAVKEISQDIKKKDIEFIKKYDKNLPELLLDKKLTHMIFQNLLSNAIKYTPEKGKVSLSITKDDKNLKITVSDTGMGIPAKQHKQIFAKLFRADNAREQDSTGTGLGLYIVKSILDQSGGNIRFDSVQDKGATFYVTIPLSGMKKKAGGKGLS